MAGLDWERAAQRDRVRRNGSDSADEPSLERRHHVHGWGAWQKAGAFDSRWRRRCAACGETQTRSSEPRSKAARPTGSQVRVARTKGDLVVRRADGTATHVAASDATRAAREVVAEGDERVRLGETSPRGPGLVGAPVKGKASPLRPVSNSDAKPPNAASFAPSVIVTSALGHAISVSASAPKKWVGRCECGWTCGPQKKTMVEAKGERHVAEADRSVRPGPLHSIRAPRVGKLSGPIATDVSCDQCGTFLMVMGTASGEAVGARCPKCRMQWALRLYDDRTQTWLREALATRSRPAAGVQPVPPPVPVTKRPAPRPARPRAAGAPCKHRIAAGQCPLCRGKGVVYITGGGMAFHRRIDCPSLAMGQRKVLQRGGQPMPIEGVVVRSLKLIARDACRTCFPVA